MDPSARQSGTNLSLTTNPSWTTYPEPVEMQPIFWSKQRPLGRPRGSRSPSQRSTSKPFTSGTVGAPRFSRSMCGTCWPRRTRYSVVTTKERLPPKKDDAEDEIDADDLIDVTDSDPLKSPPVPLTRESPPLGGSVAGSRLPPGVTPHCLSSSDTSQYAMRRRVGNTAVRRKIMSSHNVIAEATQVSSEGMASQMPDIADSSYEIEKNKIDVQLKLFTKQMAYQRDKDRRLYETSLIVNENARLAIQKQGEVVNCLAQSSTVRSQVLSVSTAEKKTVSSLAAAPPASAAAHSALATLPPGETCSPAAASNDVAPVNGTAAHLLQVVMDVSDQFEDVALRLVPPVFAVAGAMTSFKEGRRPAPMWLHAWAPRDSQLQE